MDDSAKERQRCNELLDSLSLNELALARDMLERYANHTSRGGPINWLLGIHYSEARPGFARCFMDVTHAHHNPSGLVHGGVAYTLIDSAMGAAFYHALERPLGCATIELKVNYLRSVTSGRLTATAELVDRTRRFGLLTGRVLDEQDRLIALAQGTFAIITPRPDPAAQSQTA